MQNGCAEPDMWAVSCGGGHTVCHSTKLKMAVQATAAQRPLKTFKTVLPLAILYQERKTVKFIAS